MSDKVFRFVHSADMHYSNNLDKLEETDRCSNFMLGVVESDPAVATPDVIILAGDTLDEFDGRIRLDSECARRVIALAQRAAAIAPVVIIRGTKSHDREAPYIFRHIQGRFPIYVASEIEQVALVDSVHSGLAFMPLVEALDCPDPLEYSIKAAFTLVPSVDKAHLMAQFDGSIQESNFETRQLLHDLFAGMGLVNKSMTVPTFCVIHGMMTGSQFSSGQTAIGEDLEFSLNDLDALCCDYYAMGHVHMQQTFSLPGGRMAVYSGSTGRLNMGEQEEKGFIVGELHGRSLQPLRMFPTPARTFALVSIEWDERGAEGILEAARKLAENCAGADVRFRYTIPEEHRHEVDRGALAVMFADAGARAVKVEPRILPKERQEAAGISDLQDLPSKVIKWGKVSGTVISERVLDISRVIEGRSKEELILDVEALLNSPEAVVVSGEVPLGDTGDGQGIMADGPAMSSGWGVSPTVPTIADIKEAFSKADQAESFVDQVLNRPPVADDLPDLSGDQGNLF